MHVHGFKARQVRAYATVRAPPCVCVCVSLASTLAVEREREREREREIDRERDTHTHTHTCQDLWLDLNSNRLSPLPKFDAEGPHRDHRDESATRVSAHPSATRSSRCATDTRASDPRASDTRCSSWAAHALNVAAVFDALGLPQEGCVRLD